MKISYSRVSCYLSCPQKHYFRYVEGLSTIKPVRPLQFGSDFHKLLQYRADPSKALAEIEETFDNMKPEFQTELGDDYINDLKTVFSDYQEIYKDAIQPDITEYEFNLNIGKYKGQEIVFNGFVDEIYNNDGGIIGEHKTFNYRPDMGTLAMNMQICLYAKAIELSKGITINSVMWDYIKSTPAEYPTWLDKSGRFSDAKSDKITDLSYIRCCNELNITPDESKIEQYKNNRSNYFFKVFIDIVPQMVDSVWEDFKDIIKDIINRGDTYMAKNINKDCNYCSYRPICYAEFTGADTEYIKEKEYRRVKK